MQKPFSLKLLLIAAVLMLSPVTLDNVGFENITEVWTTNHDEFDPDIHDMTSDLQTDSLTSNEILNIPDFTMMSTFTLLDDFEGGIHWQTTGLWHLVDNNSNYSNYYSPTKAMWYGQERAGNFDTNGQRNYGSLISPIIQLGSDVTTFSFWSWYETETGESFDRKEIHIRSIESGNETFIGLVDGNTNQWDQYLFNISSFAGKLIQIIFYFDTIDGISNDGLGWYVDDVALDGSFSLYASFFSEFHHTNTNFYYYWCIDYWGSATEYFEVHITKHYLDENNTKVFYDTTIQAHNLSSFDSICGDSYFELPIDTAWLVEIAVILGSLVLYSDTFNINAIAVNFNYTHGTYATQFEWFIEYFIMNNEPLNIIIDFYNYDTSVNEYIFSHRQENWFELIGSDTINGYFKGVYPFDGPWYFEVQILLDNELIHFVNAYVDVIIPYSMDYSHFSNETEFSLDWCFNYTNLDDYFELYIYYYYYNESLGYYDYYDSGYFGMHLNGTGLLCDIFKLVFPLNINSTWQIQFTAYLGGGPVFSDIIYAGPSSYNFNSYFDASNLPNVYYDYYLEYFLMKGEKVNIYIEAFYFDEVNETFISYQVILDFIDYLFDTSYLNGYFYFELPFEALWLLAIEVYIDGELVEFLEFEMNYIVNYDFYYIYNSIFPNIEINWTLEFTDMSGEYFYLDLYFYYFDTEINQWIVYNHEFFDSNLYNSSFIGGSVTYEFPFGGEWAVVFDYYVGGIYHQEVLFLDEVPVVDPTVSGLFWYDVNGTEVDTTFQGSFDNLNNTNVTILVEIYYLDPNGDLLYYDQLLIFSQILTGPSQNVTVSGVFWIPFSAEWHFVSKALIGGDVALTSSFNEIFLLSYDLELSVESRGNISYREGSTGNNIFWKPVMNNELLQNKDFDYYGSYQIFSDDTLSDTNLLYVGNWTLGDEISYNVDGLEVGDYIYTIIVTDMFGNSVEHSVIVSVNGLTDGEDPNFGDDETDNTDDTTQPTNETQATPVPPALPVNPLPGFEFLMTIFGFFVMVGIVNKLRKIKQI
jgi:hypothetical protein